MEKMGEMVETEGTEKMGWTAEKERMEKMGKMEKMPKKGTGRNVLGIASTMEKITE